MPRDPAYAIRLPSHVTYHIRHTAFWMSVCAATWKIRANVSTVAIVCASVVLSAATHDATHKLAV